MSKFYSHQFKKSLDTIRNELNVLLNNRDMEKSISIKFRNLMLAIIWASRAAGKSAIPTKNLKDKYKIQLDDRDLKILESIKNGHQMNQTFCTKQDIFKSIYKSKFIEHFDGTHSEIIKCPILKDVIVLVPGVFNEFFSTAAFERAAQYLNENGSAEYIVVKVDGTKDSESNSSYIQHQLFDFIEKNPHKRLWLVAFSKGGIDCLHFLRNNSDFANNYVRGLSTLASPILGTFHFSRATVKSLLTASKKLKSHVSMDMELFNVLENFESSLSGDQEGWFKENHQFLPRSTFYTALAFESDFIDSHFWMMLAKIFLKSEQINDGVVDADRAFFPDYFEAHNLGIVQGHHLVGSRSSLFAQEAILEAHIIFLKYLGLLN